MAFSEDEIARYARHLVLKEVGGPGQQRLRAASVALIGLGGLGGPAALYLAAAGVGRLRLIDDDAVSLANLQRQILFTTADLGQPKTAAGAARLRALNPHVGVEAVCERLVPESAERLLAGVDVVLDGSDSFAARLLANRTCHALGLPLVSGAVGRWSGQAAVFRSGQTKNRPLAERAPCYACLVPPDAPEAEACAAVGVVGALTGVIGAMMALEALKLIAKAGAPLAGRLLLYDGLEGEARTLILPPDPACPVCGDGS